MLKLVFKSSNLYRNKLNCYICKHVYLPKFIARFLCKEYIITLETLQDTITNESRANVYSHNTAIFRANKLKVLSIDNKIDLNDSIKKIYSYEDNITYTVGTTVVSLKYDPRINYIYTDGLTYFTTKKPAFDYKTNLYKNKLVSGTYCEWFGGGELKYKKKY